MRQDFTLFLHETYNKHPVNNDEKIRKSCKMIKINIIIIRLEARLRPNIGFTARFGAVRAFVYNSAESEPIWMKSGALCVHYWGLALADIGRDLRSSDSLRGRRNFCQVNNARFHRFSVGQISRNLNVTTFIGVAMKTFGTKF